MTEDELREAWAKTRHVVFDRALPTYLGPRSQYQLFLSWANEMEMLYGEESNLEGDS